MFANSWSLYRAATNDAKGDNRMASHTSVRQGIEPGIAVNKNTAGRLYSEREGTRPILALRLLGAVALLAMGALHLQQYLGAEYSAIPTIGTLFVLNFAGALVLAIGLLAPLERLLPRFGAAAVSLLSLGGLAMAATSIAFLLTSEHTPLFGFMESGYRTPIVVALISEGTAVVLLGIYAVAHFRGLRSAPRA
jgi:hypothetical protein